MEELQKEIEEVRELANNRLQELDRLHLQHREALKEVEKLKMDVSLSTVDDLLVCVLQSSLDSWGQLKNWSFETICILKLVVSSSYFVGCIRISPRVLRN